MNNTTLYSIIASPLHRDCSSLYQKLNIDSTEFTSVRQAIKHLKQHPPDVVVADFIYGYGNNYAGVNISNLDVFLYALQKQAPNAKVIVFAEKTELTFVDKLKELFDIHRVLVYPISDSELENALRDN